MGNQWLYMYSTIYIKWLLERNTLQILKQIKKALHNRFPQIHDKGNKCSFKLDIQLFPEILLVELRGKSIPYSMFRNKRNIFFKTLEWIY
jgi:hypothetical protein